MEHVREETVMQWLEEVKDPEIPVLSLVDLGVISRVSVANGEVTIEMTPTFVGCPALEVMKEEIRVLLNEKGIDKLTIHVSFQVPWTSDRISEKGRQALKKFGLSPPPDRGLIEDVDFMKYAECPHCGGTNTELRSPFGARGE